MMGINLIVKAIKIKNLFNKKVNRKRIAIELKFKVK